MRGRVLLLSLAVLAIAAACGKGSQPPVVPPEGASASAPPRFDGVYAAQKGEAIDLLRFTAEGHAASITTQTQRTLEKAVRSLIAENERCAKGTWAIKDGILRFTLKSKNGSVEYAGAIKEDKLALKWRSDINSVSADDAFTFVRVQEEDADAGAPAASEDDADASAPLPPVVVSADASLVPDGSGWFCFKAGNAASRCERKQAACESGRKTAATVRKDLKIGKCARQATAFCFTATRAGGRGAASCSLTPADCDAERSAVAAEADADLSVSTCGKM